MGISVRVIQDLEDFYTAAQIQREVWGFSETDLVAPRLLTVATHIGGVVLGAFDGDKLIGFSLALPGVKTGGQPYWHSHMTGVLPAYQNRGIGRDLKLAQREAARSAGIELIEWTFDPLEIRNAHFNIERLGVIVRRFVPNQYGITSSKLHGGLPTDRLVAEWFVNSPRVRAIVDRGEKIEARVEDTIQVSALIDDWRRGDTERARQEQEAIRIKFGELLGAGFAAVGYQRSNKGGAYQLGRIEDQPVAIG